MLLLFHLREKMFMSLKSNPQYQLWKIIFRCCAFCCCSCCCHKNLFRIKKSSFVLTAKAKESWKRQKWKQICNREGKQSRKKRIKRKWNARIFRNVLRIREKSETVEANRIIVLSRLQQLRTKLAKLLWLSVMTRRDFHFQFSFLDVARVEGQSLLTWKLQAKWEMI